MNKKIAGFLIISTALLFMGVWEFWGRERFSYREVLTLKEDVSAGAVIKEDNLRVEKMDNVSVKALKPQDAQKLTGMEAVQFTAADSPLFAEYFTEPALAAGE